MGRRILRQPGLPRHGAIPLPALSDRSADDVAARRGRTDEGHRLMLRERRSASQILFGFLPDQTVDLRGRVWKVAKWVEPVRAQVDVTTLRRELCRQAAPWSSQGLDNRYVERLMRGDR